MKHAVATFGRKLTAAALILGVAACGGTIDELGGGMGGGGTGGGSVQPGIVKGAAVDTQGKPLPGAQVVVCSTVFSESCIMRQTGSDGRYSADLTPTNEWAASAYIAKAFNGKNYCLELRPDSMEHFGSKDGAVRNFEWKLTGLRPGENAADQYLSYYGAGLEVTSDEYVNYIDVRYVHVNLIPQGTLVDGSTGQSISGVAGAWNWNTIGNLPLGRYSVTAEYAPPSASRSALRLATSYGGQYAASLVLDFDPDFSGQCDATHYPKATVHVRY